MRRHGPVIVQCTNSIVFPPNVLGLKCLDTVMDLAVLSIALGLRYGYGYGLAAKLTPVNYLVKHRICPLLISCHVTVRKFVQLICIISN